MNPLTRYLHDLQEIHSTGATVPETSYYPVLRDLLCEVGSNLKPEVRCFMGLRKDKDADFPDGGLFTISQVDRSTGSAIPGQIPARGVIEVKSASDDAWVTASSEQVAKYWDRYRKVLVTNYRDFVLVGQGSDGRPVKLDSYRLASSEAGFWDAARHPLRTSKVHGERFVAFLTRVILHDAPLADPKDVAWFLASYAREALSRLAGQDLEVVKLIRADLETALGLKFKGDKGSHFFASSLVQTLFYGIFAAWVLWAKEMSSERSKRFNWHEAAWSLRVPMIRAVFELIATRSRLSALGLVDILDFTEYMLNRVDLASFLLKFEERNAVQYFYEPFLKAFDPELRNDLGVWYTPPEIVKYMVERVDRALRDELGLRDGLADPRVYVIDPCCGTGAFLVEVLRRIHTTLSERNGDALLSDDVRKAATQRVFGFEILPAPFVIAHLQIGLLLQSLEAPLSAGTEERAAVYLTNALTGWDPPGDAKRPLLLPELEYERDQATRIKRDVPILVVLGNPPYNAFAGVSSEEERDLVEPYKQGLVSVWGIKKFNMDDLYIRFFRLAERRVAEMTGKGIVCFISNKSWTHHPSFVVLRQHLLTSFDKFWIDNMHGDRTISERAPDGKSSQTVFAIRGFSPGIRQGTAISLWVKTGRKGIGSTVAYRNDLDHSSAEARRAALVDSLSEACIDRHYVTTAPAEDNLYSFEPVSISAMYASWPAVNQMARLLGLGILENRKDAMVSIDRSVVEARMRMYFDPAAGWDALADLGTGLTTDAARFDARRTRDKLLLKHEEFDESMIKRLVVRPMDVRWCYYCPIRPLWNEPRPRYYEQYKQNPLALVTRKAGVAEPEGYPFYFVSALGAQHVLYTDAYYVPLSYSANDSAPVMGAQAERLVEDSETGAVLTGNWNLSAPARDYVASLGLRSGDGDPSELVWMHVLAVGYSRRYLEDNTDGIRRTWPRVPLPATKEQLKGSAELGRRVAALLDTETGVVRALPPEVQLVGRVARVGGGSLNPDREDLEVTAGWGYHGKNGVVMPGQGRVLTRPYTAEELAPLGPDRGHVLNELGDNTCDVYLNDLAYWSNIPQRVWECFIGGYQVLKKWLSYREKDILGRSLTVSEVRLFAEIARRLTTVLLLGAALDENYLRVRDNAALWRQEPS